MQIRNKPLNDAWNCHWQNVTGQEKLTPLAKAMFRAKRSKLRHILSQIGPDDILEAGCGMGEIMETYAEMGFKVSGIDFSVNAVNICRKKGLDAHHASIERTTGTFDLVSSDGLLEHMIDFTPVAKHLMRLSRKYVLLIQPNYNSSSGQILACMANVFRNDKIIYEYNYRLEDFITVFQHNGFMIRCNIPVFLDVFRILLFEKSTEV